LVAGGVNVDYAKFVEFGNRTRQARPYLSLYILSYCLEQSLERIVILVDNTRTHAPWLHVDTIFLLKIGFRMLDSKIPALSIREPYATLILEGKKDIELRSWKPKAWVKEFYIHVPVVADKGLCKEHNIIPQSPKTIIGKARISEIKYYDTTDEFMKDYSRHHCKSFWKYDYGFVLDNVVKVEPVYGIPGKRFFFFTK